MHPIGFVGNIIRTEEAAKVESSKVSFDSVDSFFFIFLVRHFDQNVLLCVLILVYLNVIYKFIIPP